MSSEPNGPTSASAANRLDAVFDALSHERRRRTLYYLRQRPGGAASITDLAEALSERPNDGPPVDAVVASLVHHHLPKLDDAGLVEHDSRSDTVRFDSDDPVTTELLELMAALERR